MPSFSIRIPFLFVMIERLGPVQLDSSFILMGAS